jgi:fructose-1,6-bisphosphatase/inositol monophosphatase family enzyme
MIDELKNILKAVGSGLLRWQGRAGGEWQGAQLKTEADREAHQALSCALTGLLNVPVLSEEDPESHAAIRPEKYWLIDPIDGTASLAGGFDGFVTQAALMENGEPVLAAVYAPALEWMYTAEKGGGAFLNGSRIRVAADPSRLILVDNYPEPKGTAAEMMKALACTGYLESGSISLKILRVADGSADLFFKDVVVRDWDVGAPWLILKEAGGTLAAVDGKPYRFSGNLEKQGLIAARCPELCNAAAEKLAG